MYIIPLNCPFCGAPAELERDSDHHGEWFNLGCSKHFGRVDPPCPGGRLWYTASPDNEAEAIAAWNKRATPAERAAPMEKPMTFTDDQIRHMVNRFLGWRLPDPWHPDGGIEFKPEFNVEYMASQGKPPMRHEPTGTNLFDYKQSTAMVRYMVEGMERAGDAALAERLRALSEKATPGKWWNRSVRRKGGVFDLIVEGRDEYRDIGQNMSEADAKFVAALVNAYRAGALSPAPRDGGWNAAIEAAAQWHTRMARTAARGTGNTARHEWYAEQIRALARPLPAPPTEDGR